MGVHHVVKYGIAVGVALLAWVPLAAQAKVTSLRVSIHPEPGFYVQERGVAVLVPVPGGTQVTVQLKGVPPGVSEPMHIHKGLCGHIDPMPAWALNPVNSSGYSQTVIPTTVEILEAGPYAINVHQSPQDLTVYVACGNIQPVGH